MEAGPALTTVVFSRRAFIRITLISETNTRRKICSPHMDNNNSNLNMEEVKVSTKEAEVIMEGVRHNMEEARLSMEALKTTILPCWKKPCRAFPARIIPSTPKFPRQVSPVMAKSMAATTVIPRRSAKCSTFAPTTGRGASADTLSCAPTAPSSTKNTSFVIGGSILTAPRPRLFTASTRRLRRNARLPLKRCCRPRPPMVKPLT